MTKRDTFIRISSVLFAGILLSECNQATDKTTSKDSTQVQENSAATIANVIPVTVANFSRAESDMYFNTAVKEAGGVGKFHHWRELMPIDKQVVIRPNRDVLYSSAVFDLDAGPVTVTLPDPGKRFMSLIVIDEDHYSETLYAPGTFTFSKEKVGTRYILLGLRTLIDPNDPKDYKAVTALQDAVKAEQKGQGTFEIPDWDKVSQKSVRDSLVNVSKSLADSKGMFGKRGEVDSTRHTIGSATGWGGNAEKDATYIIGKPERNDGKTNYKLTVKRVPVDGFWSVTVYNKEGYLQKNDLNSYSLNSITAKKEGDGSVNIQFGGCDGKTPNCLPITDGWSYWVRLYRPHKEILDGTWKFPVAQAIK